MRVVSVERNIAQPEHVKERKKKRFNIYKIFSDQRFQCKGVAHFSCKSPSVKHEK